MQELYIKEEVIETATGQRIDLPAGDKIVGITIKNQGTSTVLTAFNSDTGINEILPLSSEGYGGIPGYYLSGYVKVLFSGAGTNKAIVKYFIDKAEICE